MVTTTNLHAVEEAARHVAEQLKKRIDGDERAQSLIICYPHDHDKIGKWGNWVVLNTGTRPRFLGSLVPWGELYALFRDTFQPLGITVNSPRADIYHDRVWEHDHKQPFTPSGRTIEVRTGEVAYLRAVCQFPYLSLGWALAALHVDSNVPDADSAGPRVACVIDRSEARRDYWDIFEIVDQMPTIYVRFLDCDYSSPVARLVGADTVTGVAVFELDASVELSD